MDSPLLSIFRHRFFRVRFPANCFARTTQKYPVPVPAPDIKNTLYRSLHRIQRILSSYSAVSGFSTAAIAPFCMGMRQFLLLPNSTIMVSSVMSITVP